MEACKVSSGYEEYDSDITNGRVPSHRMCEVKSYEHRLVIIS